MRGRPMWLLAILLLLGSALAGCTGDDARSSDAGTDRDRDGVNDSEDDCPGVRGNATNPGGIGCPDSDLDGHADQNDSFPLEPTQWADTDGDGFGDNWGSAAWNDTRDPTAPGEWVPGAAFADACPSTAGQPTNDRNGCPDADGDRTSDITDAFPTDPSQHADGDGDGYGDDPDGTTPDACPDTAGTSTQGKRWGCPDGDGDGWDDLIDEAPGDPMLAHDGDADGVDDQLDAFPSDPQQHTDTDGDGFGDNTSAASGDDCPAAYGSSTEDVLGCVDGDGDGWSDLGDAFPTDDTQWNDTDEDGYGDESTGFRGDDCPTQAGNSSANDTRGCPDADGDGWADSEDAWPSDGSRWAADQGTQNKLMLQDASMQVTDEGNDTMVRISWRSAAEDLNWSEVQIVLVVDNRTWVCRTSATSGCAITQSGPDDGLWENDELLFLAELDTDIADAGTWQAEVTVEYQSHPVAGSGTVEVT